MRNPKGNAPSLAMYWAAEKFINMSPEKRAKYVAKNGAEEIELAAVNSAAAADMAAHRELRQLTIGDKINVNPDWKPEVWEAGEEDDDEPIPSPRWTKTLS